MMDKDMTAYGIEEIKRLADKDNPDALYELGIRYLGGKGVDTSEDEAKKYLIFAMQLGSVAACKRLGNIFIAENSIELGLHAYKTGIKRGDLECAYLYAVHIMSDNQIEAVEVLTEAYESGSEKSGRLLKNLGLMS